MLLVGYEFLDVTLDNMNYFLLKEIPRHMQFMASVISVMTLVLHLHYFYKCIYKGNIQGTYRGATSYFFFFLNNVNFVNQMYKWIQAALLSPWGICKASDSCCLVL